MANINIAIINACSVLTNNQIHDAMPALQKQIERDFAPSWGINAELTFVPKGSQANSAFWWLAIVDDPDIADALGYHDLTPAGLPMGKVFAALDKRLHLQWTVTASHELLEMLADPDVNLSAFVQTGGNTGTFYSYEVCDPCEEDGQGYQIDGIQVSDFVFPAWFEGFRGPGSTQFDQCKRINAPFELLPGGYSLVLDVPSGLGWYQISVRAEPQTSTRKIRPSVGSRRERRMTPRNQWLPSTNNGNRSR